MDRLRGIYRYSQNPLYSVVYMANRWFEGMEFMHNDTGTLRHKPMYISECSQ